MSLHIVKDAQVPLKMMGMTLPEATLFRVPLTASLKHMLNSFTEMNMMHLTKQALDFESQLLASDVPIIILGTT